MAIIKKVLVTGSEGYIGSILMPLLKNKGYDITGLDTCFYSDGNLNNNVLQDYQLIKEDIRDISEDVLEDFDAVVHLAALSNDPLGMLDENLTYEINYKASVKLAEIAKKKGVKRFLFSSSCSLYGASDNILTEEDKANPQTAYGKSKILAEQEISKLADENFSPVFLRNATAFGISPRMRFDIVVNSLTGYAKTENEIKILGDGKPWRPLVSVKDICGTIVKVLEAGKEVIHNQAFNVGSSKENYQIKTIAEKVKERYDDCSVVIMQKDSGDSRNYKVSFDKLNKVLGYDVEVSLNNGISEIADCYDSVELNTEKFNHRYYTRLKQIEYLFENKIIDNNLRWNNGLK